MTTDELRSYALAELASVDDGQPFSELESALLDFALASSVTALDEPKIDLAMARAFAAGARPEQIQEVASLIAGLGVHTLMATARKIATTSGIANRSLTDDEQESWNRRVGQDPFWDSFEREMPGFLGAMLRLSVDQFEAFFEFCSVPWKSGTLRAQLKELIAMASDATPAHCFAPGFRLHLANAIKIGAGRRQIIDALDRAAAT